MFKGRELLLLFNYFSFLYFIGAIYLSNLYACLILLCYIIFFNIGWSLLKRDCNFIVSKNISLNYPNHWLNFCSSLVDSLIFILLILAIYKIYNIGVIDFFLISRATRALITRSDLFLSIFDEIVVGLLWFQLSLCLYLNNKLSFFTVIGLLAMIAFGFFTVSLSMLVMVTLPFVMYKLDSSKHIKVFILMLVLGPFIATIWKPLLSFLFFNSSFSVQSLQLPAELTSWVNIFQTISTTYDFNYFYGSSYLDTILGVIFPFSNTVPLSIWYVQTYYPEIYLRGGGKGFSFFIEAYLNFGILGVIFVGTLTGFIFKSVQIKKSKSLFVQFIYFSLIGIIYKFFRSESYSVFKNLAWLQFFPIICILLFCKLLLIAKRNERNL